jgi:hypothetical protein
MIADRRSDALHLIAVNPAWRGLGIRMKVPFTQIIVFLAPKSLEKLLETLDTTSKRKSFRNRVRWSGRQTRHMRGRSEFRPFLWDRPEHNSGTFHPKGR